MKKPCRSCYIGVLLSTGLFCWVSEIDAQSLLIYDDAIQTPWIDASWSATNNFANTSRAFTGVWSIETVLRSWGALRLRSGSWGAPVAVNPALYSGLHFAIYPTATVSLYLSNDQGQSFPTLTGSLPANVWTVVDLPMNVINPNNRTIHSVILVNPTSTTRTFYVDDLGFVSAGPSDTTAPMVAITAPSNGTTVNAAALTVSGTAADNPEGSGVQKVQVRLNGGAWQQAAGTTAWSLGLTLAEGINAVEAQSVDTANLASSIAQINVTYIPETVKPIVVISTPVGGTNFTSPGITVTGAAEDNVGGSGLKEVNVRNNGGAWQIASGTAAWTYNLTLVNGANLIEARSVDNAGNLSDLTSVNVTDTRLPR